MNTGKNRITFWMAFLVSAVLIILFVSPCLGAEAGGVLRPPTIPEILLLPRVWVGALFCLFGLVLLVTMRINRKIRLISLIVIFFAFGIFSSLPLGEFARGMGLHPSPVCSITKPFLFLRAGRDVPSFFLVILGTIAVLSLLGNKLFCGWACPIGALQELVHQIPVHRRYKRVLPFRATNLVRILLAVLFIPAVLSAGFSLYDLFNPFETLHWSFAPLSLAVLFVTLAAAVFIFRPFCYAVCPIGLLTWVLEHLSLVRVKVVREACTECNLCLHLSPCPAVGPILKQKKLRPDCHACGRCLELCPEKALTFEKF